MKYYKIDEEFDRTFLDICVKGDHKALLREITTERMSDEPLLRFSNYYRFEAMG